MSWDPLPFLELYSLANRVLNVERICLADCSDESRIRLLSLGEYFSREGLSRVVRGRCVAMHDRDIEHCTCSFQDGLCDSSESVTTDSSDSQF